MPKRSTILAMIVFLMAGVFLLAPKISLADTWSVGNYTPYNPVAVSNIDWNSVTHMNHVAARPNSDGTLNITTNNLAGTAPALITAAHANNVKVLLSVETGASTNYFKTAIEKNLNGFVSSIISNVNTYGYDGVDIDWEAQDFSSTTIQNDMTNLLTSLRNSLGSGKLLTVDVATSPVDARYWTSSTIGIYNKLDRISVMTYDEAGLGSWNPYVWHNSALHGYNGVVSFDSVKANYLAGGLTGNSGKLNFGLAFYGDAMTGVCQTSACTNGVTAPKQSFYAGSGPAVQKTYAQIKATYGNLDSSNPNWHWDATADVPYLSIDNSGASNDQFITYDDAQSLTDKMNYIKSNNLGGWIMWMNDQEYNASGVTDAQKYPLGNAVALALGKTTTCTSFTYSTSWSTCVNSLQTRTVVTSLPTGCTGGNPIISQSCTMPTSAPTVITNLANNISQNNVVLNGAITSDGNLTITRSGFNYGTTISYGNNLPQSPTITGIGTFSSSLSGLLPNTTYHYQAYASNNSGTAYGTDQTFTTSPLDINTSEPTVETFNADNISTSSASLNGIIIDTGNLDITDSGFYLGTSTAYGIIDQKRPAVTTTIAFNYVVHNLIPGTTYHYQTYASNTLGTAIGSDKSFTTATEQNQPPTDNDDNISVQFSSNLKYGQRSSDVKTLQIFLVNQDKGNSAATALSKYTPTTYFGAATRKAITEYQKLNGLTVTYYLDTPTRTKINGLKKILIPTTSNGKTTYTLTTQ